MNAFILSGIAILAAVIGAMLSCMQSSTKKTCFMLVDVQPTFMPNHTTLDGSFLPNGGLPVINGNGIIPSIVERMQSFHFTATSQDWHPESHKSFAQNHHGKDRKPLKPFPENGVTWVTPSGESETGPGWPKHGIQGERESEIHPDIERILPKDTIRVFKGTKPNVESFGAFHSQNPAHEITGLHNILQKNKVMNMVVVGLALDYCVKETALQAIRHGYETYVVLEGCRAVDQTPGGMSKTESDLRNAGVKVVNTFSELPKYLFK
jgi:nicotinamidase/pyrazinamidase